MTDELKALAEAASAFYHPDHGLVRETDAFKPFVKACTPELILSMIEKQAKLEQQLDINRAFHKVAVKERDYERRQNDTLRSQLQAARDALRMVADLTHIDIKDAPAVARQALATGQEES